MHSEYYIYNHLMQTDASIDKQIEEVKKIAEQNYCELDEVRNSDGSLMLSPLLLAKASCLNGMALLKAAEMNKRK